MGTLARIRTISHLNWNPVVEQMGVGAKHRRGGVGVSLPEAQKFFAPTLWILPRLPPILRQFYSQGDRCGHTLFPCDALASNIKGCAVVGGGADKG